MTLKLPRTVPLCPTARLPCLIFYLKLILLNSYSPSLPDVLGVLSLLSIEKENNHLIKILEFSTNFLSKFAFVVLNRLISNYISHV